MWASLRDYLENRYYQTHVASLFSPPELISMVLSLILIGIIIPTLFFFVGSKVESQVMTKQANYVVDGLTKNIQAFTTPDQQTRIQQLIDQYVQVPDMAAADEQVTQKNQALLGQAYTWIGIGVAIAGCIILGLLYWEYRGDNFVDFPWHDIFWENLLSVVGVAGTELAVLYIVGANYKSADINQVKRQLVTTVKNFATS